LYRIFVSYRISDVIPAVDDVYPLLAFGYFSTMPWSEMCVLVMADIKSHAISRMCLLLWQAVYRVDPAGRLILFAV